MQRTFRQAFRQVQLDGNRKGPALPEPYHYSQNMLLRRHRRSRRGYILRHGRPTPGARIAGKGWCLKYSVHSTGSAVQYSTGWATGPRTTSRRCRAEGYTLWIVWAARQRGRNYSYETPQHLPEKRSAAGTRWIDPVPRVGVSTLSQKPVPGGPMISTASRPP